MLDLKSLCEQVKLIAKDAGQFLREERKHFDLNRVEEKNTHDYVSYADRSSEKMIIKALGKLPLEASFLGEESGQTIDNKPYRWVIDPLDGTTNYIHDIAPYCVSIGLCDKQDILLGVVYEICRDECFYAWKGSGAFRDGQAIHVSDVDDLDKAFVAMGFPYNSEAYKPTALHFVDGLYGHAGGCRLLGAAAAELCYVACGRVDARAEAYIGEWDVTAGGLIVQEAGGLMTDYTGGDSWRTGREVLASNGKIHTLLQGLLKI